MDTDNDGIPNRLDLDSDKDGCADAIEASSSTTARSTTSYPTGTDTNGNGLLNNYESSTAGTISYTSTYYYALNNAISVCLDTDGDLKPDVFDIDDDNDGVLDTAEQNCTTTSAITNGGFELPTGIGFPTNSNMVGWKTTATDQTMEIWTNGYYSVPSAEGNQFVELNAYQASSLYQKLNVKAGEQISWSLKHRGRSGVDVASVSIGSTILGSPQVALMSDGNTAWGSYSGTYTVPVGQTETYFVIGTVSSAGGDLSVGNFIDDVKVTLTSCPDLDTDNDGIPNRLDLDSDGDGCADAIEASSSRTAKSTTVYPIGDDTNGNGLLNNYEASTAGTISYVSTYSNYALSSLLNACLDTDSDGLGDLFDLDDDNDGLLDIVERSCSTTITLSPTNGGVKAENTAPTGWVKSVSSPDIADATGHPYGTWNVGCIGTAPLPPNGHSTWMSFFSNTQEAFKTTVNNLIAGNKYSLTVYYGKFAALGVGLGQVTTKLGSTVIDQYTPTLGCGWEIRTITFTATAASQDLEFQNTGDISKQLNTNISISANAISPVCTDVDTDGDGIPNHLDLDSDNDGCSDANETYNSLTAQGTDGNTYYGTGNPPATNADGTVIGASYTASSPNTLIAGSASTITTQPVNQTVNVTENAVFSATITAGSGTTSYQWQISTDGGATWSNVSNNSTYSGATSTSLTVSSVTSAMQGHRFRLNISQSDYLCGNITSNIARLTIGYLPSIVDDSFAVVEDTPLNGSVFTNDSGSAGSTLTLTTFKIGTTTYNAGQTATIAGVGTITVRADGTFTFTPDPNYNGAIPSIDYTAVDANNGTDSGTLSLTLTPVNDAPAVVASTETTPQNTAISGNVLTGKSSDTEGNTLSLSTFTIDGTTYNVGQTATIAGKGTLVINADGSYTFTPATGYVGAVPVATFTLSDGNGGTASNSLTLSVTNVNDAPLAGDDSFTGTEDASISGNVLTNDSDVDGDALKVTQFVVGTSTVTVNPTTGGSTTIAGVGTISMNADGSFTFTPVANYNGTVPAITYTLSDGTLTDTGALSLTVTAVNDAPVAVDDIVNATEDTPLTGNVLTDGTDDSDVDGNTLTVSTFTINGTSYNAGTTASIAGVGTVIVNADGSYTFTPALNYTGTVPVITYAISDGNGGTDTGDLKVTMVPVNDAPLATDDSFTGAEDAPITGNLIANDSDVEGSPLTVTGYTIAGVTGPFTIGVTETIPDVGTIRVNSDGTFTFTPAPNYNGTVPVITYTVSDGTLSDTGALSLTVTAVNDAPVAVDDIVNATEDTPITGNVLTDGTDDSDVDGNTLTVSTFTINGTSYNAGTTASIAGVGTVIVNADGSYTFTPALNYAGTVPDVTYAISDGNGGTDIGALKINMTAVNDAPVAADDSFTGAEDAVITGNLITNDSDVEGASLSITGFSITGLTGPFVLNADQTIPNVGTIRINSDGSFTFTPLANYDGTVPAIIYTVTDGNSTDTAELDLFVAPLNDAPIIGNSTQTVNEDTPANGTVLTGLTDTDTPLANIKVTEFTFTIPGGSNYTFAAGTLTTIPGVGTLVVNEDGTYTFTPNSNWNGTVPLITFNISDGEGGEDTGTLAITVTAVNDDPVAVNDDNIVSPEDAPVTGNVLSNDSDPDGNPIVVKEFTIAGLSGTFPAGTSATIPGVGTIIINTNGDFTFTPELNYNGTLPTITYVASDNALSTDAATLNITISPVNDLPVANPNLQTINEDSPATGNVITNDSDVETANSSLAVTQFSFTVGTVTSTFPAGTTATIPNVGTIVVNADGSYVFTPNANYSGAVPDINYTISDGTGGTATSIIDITITPVNDAPAAVNDSKTGAEDATLSGTVLTNDTDIDGAALSVTSFTVAGGTPITVTSGTPGTTTIANVGSITINADGTYTFTPLANYTGTVPVITYTVSDGTATATANLSLSITAVNDNPIAVADSQTIAEDSPATGNVITNDSDVETANSSLTVTQFSFTVGTITSTFPVGTTATIPNVGTIVVNADGSYVFTPLANYSGEVPDINYTISDGTGGTATSIIDITVSPVNDAPAAVNDSNTGAEDATLSGTVLANDSDIDSGTLSITSFTVAGGTAISVSSTTPGTTTIANVGSITINSDGTYAFTPLPNYNGTVPVITYTITDGSATASATLSLSITAVNDNPTAQNDINSGDEGSAVSGTVLTNDSDLENNNLSVSQFTIAGVTYPAGTIAEIPNVGSFVINANGTYTFTPEPNYTGSVPVATYTLSDGNGGSSTATLSITMNPINDAPVVVNETVRIPEDTVASGNLLSNDTDEEGTTLTISNFTVGGQTYPVGQSVSLQGVGTIVINADGTYTFTPVENYNGNLPLIGYNVTDGLATVPATLSLSVSPVNDAPTVQNETLATPQNTVATGNVLTNDKDVDGDVISITQFTIDTNGDGSPEVFTAGSTATIAGKGTLVINADGSFTFTPATNYYSTVPLATYQVSDGTTSASATLNLSVSPVDTDGDGVMDFQELLDGTSPTNSCSIKISSQVLTPSLIWTNSDCDGDGTTNGEELFNGTGILDPCAHAPGAIPNTSNIIWQAADCDGDGETNGTETANNTNPNDPCSYTVAPLSGSTAYTQWSALDCDGDGESNGTEIANNTDPKDLCSYSVLDLSKVSDAWKSADCDVDGLTNNEEATGINDPNTLANPDGDITNPLLADTDGDGVSDYQEAIDGTNPNNGCSYNSTSQTLTTSTTWNNLDCDNDGETNATELANNTNPQDACSYTTAPVSGTAAYTSWSALDCDGDGVTNGVEITNNTDPKNGCSYVIASQDVTKVSTAWSNSDCDSDGLTNGEEATGVDNPTTLANPDGEITNPLLADTDGDGVSDYQEAIDGTNPNNGCSYNSTSQTLTTSTTWNNLDCDNDGETNATELANNTNPQDACSYTTAPVSGTAAYTSWSALDCDGDGVTNGVEITNNTDPKNGCSYVIASQDITKVSTTWSNSDCDSDGLTNGEEATGVDNPTTTANPNGFKTNPIIADTDGDGNPDNTDPHPTTPTALNDTANASIGNPTTVNILMNDDFLPNDNNVITQTGGTATGTVSFDSITGEMTYMPAASEVGTTVTLVYQVCQGTICATATITIIVAVEDTDGDGVSDVNEAADGTDPTDPCDFNPVNQVIADASAAWLAADCDGDGTPNGSDTSPLDPCVFVIGSTPDITNQIWQAADCDGDGLTNNTEGLVDTDGDGIPDYQDTDSDNDGIPDSVEKGPNGATPIDTDGDGTPDYRDLDSDNDGIPDSVEDSSCTGTAPCTPTDTDGDGVPNYLDLDSDGDGIPDSVERGPNGATPVDTDGDGAPDYLDADSDGDGIPDSVEDAGCTGTAPCTPTDTDGDGVPNYLDADSDGDGIPDTIEKGPNGATPVDTDGDGTPDYLDLDSDNDGIPDSVEKGPNGATPIDTDGDGTPDYLDTDSDNDGIPDAEEAGPDPRNPVDTDGDGIPDYQDTDSDGDGIPDSVEKGPNGATPVDTDNDGTPDYRDLDSDNDGIPDSVEKGSNGATPIDTDGDGTPDYLDLDSDNDGIPDSVEKGPNGATPVDTDNDGTPDYRDLDSDNDGIPDSVEKGSNGATPIDTDGDGTPDYLDLDSDNDGIPDSVEKGSNGATPIDTDGDGTPDYLDLDSDNDGIPDSVEKGPNGATPIDTDGDGTPDYKDLDSDNDGSPDADEKGPDGTNPIDTDGDGVPDYRDLPNVNLNPDTDGDGVTDSQELIDGTDPTDPCSSNPQSITVPLSQLFLDGDCDGDGLSNGEELGLNPMLPTDVDNNGTADYLEFNNHSQSEDDLEIFNSMTTNGDGLNDVFVIRGIENYPDNNLYIYNRWGVEVYNVEGYGQDNKYFTGISQGRNTFSQTAELPKGTYYFILRYKNKQGVDKQRSGYLYITK